MQYTKYEQIMALNEMMDADEVTDSDVVLWEMKTLLSKIQERAKRDHIEGGR